MYFSSRHHEAKDKTCSTYLTVNSWEGGKSVLDTEMEGEKRNHKRHWSDDYEDELDHGKTKKVKKYHSDCNVHSGYNAFQKYQDNRNYENNRVSHDRQIQIQIQLCLVL